MAKTPVYWTGPAPTHCDIDRSQKITTVFIDGKTKMGPWGNMSPKSHARYGVGLGTGRGQKFEKQEDGRFLKVES